MYDCDTCTAQFATRASRDNHAASHATTFTPGEPVKVRYKGECGSCDFDHGIIATFDRYYEDNEAVVLTCRGERVMGLAQISKVGA